MYAELVPAWLRNSDTFSVVITDLEGNYGYVNRSMMNRFAHIKEDYFGKPVHDSIHPEDLPAAQRATEACLRNPGEVVPVSLRKPGLVTGKFISSFWEFSTLQGTNDEVIGIMCVGISLSESEFESRRSAEFNQRVDSIANEISEAFISVNHKWVIELVNFAASELFARSSEDLQGSKLEELIGQIPDQLKEAMINLRTTSFEDFYPHVGKWLNIMAHPSIQGVKLYISDVTEQKVNEARMSELLELTLRQNKRLQNFAHIVSHNLRSHSNNINTLIEYFKLDFPHLQSENLVEMLTNSASKLSDTVENLAQVSKLTRSHSDDLEEVNLGDRLNNALSVVAPDLVKCGVKVLNEIDPSLQVRVIPAYLDSILLNLLTNAIKYRDDQKEPTVWLQTTTNEHFVVLSVEDNGLGIDLERHERKMFGMYKTFHNHPDARGIGLFITKNQVEAMGGYIEVESTPYKGSVFTVSLQR